jgi:hypothetical protein
MNYRRLKTAAAHLMLARLLFWGREPTAAILLKQSAAQNSEMFIPAEAP